MNSNAKATGRGRESHTVTACSDLPTRLMEWPCRGFHPACSLVSEHGRVLSLEIGAVVFYFFWSTTRNIEALSQDSRKLLRNPGLRGGLLENMDELHFQE